VADSQKLQALKALTTLLEGIAPSSYNGRVVPASLAGAVFRGRSKFGDSDPDLMLSILEAPRGGSSSSNSTGEGRLDSWPLLIQGWSQDDKDNPSDPVYMLLDDVEKRLDRIIATSNNTGQAAYPEHYMLGGLITKFDIQMGVVRPPTENVSSKSFFYLPVQVGLARIARE
jgi:hypothetical protein